MAVSSREFHEVFMKYREEFGDTFTTVHIDEGTMETAVIEMESALNGGRGPVTDDDLGINLEDNLFS